MKVIDFGLLLPPQVMNEQSVYYLDGSGSFLSQVDENTSYEDLIEISGILRDQALKILKKFVEKGFIGV